MTDERVYDLYKSRMTVTSNSRVSKDLSNLSSRNLSLLNQILKEPSGDAVVEILKNHIVIAEEPDTKLSRSSSDRLYPIELILDCYKDTCNINILKSAALSCQG